MHFIPLKVNNFRHDINQVVFRFTKYNQKSNKKYKMKKKPLKPWKTQKLNAKCVHNGKLQKLTKL